MPDDVLPDDERLYRLVRQEAWEEALRWLHRAWRALDGNARARRAAEVFDDAFLADLDARPPEALERRLMLHHGQMRPLPAEDRARLVDALARRKRADGDAEAVRALGRLAPTAGERPAPAATQRLTLTGEEAPVRVERIAPGRSQPDARTSLFKSDAERTLFGALRTAFSSYVVYPNAALSATLDFERLKPHLTDAERRYFFRALVDAVVADPLCDLRPVHFFELDSAYHDAPERRHKDSLKDAILSKAGQVLFRLRPVEADASEAALAQAIREAVEGEAPP